jgi:lipoprotein-anchoring transpeptidase ErfK/SrfK
MNFPPFIKALPALLLVVAAAGLSSCNLPKKHAKHHYSTSFEPKVEPVKNPSAVKVKISTAAQRIYVVEGDRVLLASPCSVGTAKTPTPAGHHRILSKTAQRRRVSQPGAGYPMTYWMSFYSPAYGMHWGWVKPHPCTHGCVRLPIQTARKMFDMVQVGTPVHVAATHPEDANHGSHLPVLDDSTLADPPNSYMMSPQVFADAAKGKVYTY